jgi:Fuc2NAc and GlcNAc transferase
MQLLACLVLLTILSYFSIGLYRAYALKKDILDHPNHRSTHQRSTPRGGGIVFLVLWSVFLLTLYFFNMIKIRYLLSFLPAVALIGTTGFCDDRHHVRVRWRLLFQLLAVVYTLFLIGGFPSIYVGIGVIHWGWFGHIFIALALLWSINLYNFMDGIDGLAAIEALFVFGFGGYFIWHAGGISLAWAAWGIAGIVFGFLCWNKPPAKIFMGDAGSTLLGFLVGLFAIIGEIKYRVPALLWVILYGVFWFDSTLTLIRRLFHGDKVYQAHRLQAFHRLISVGWSTKKVLLGVAILNINLVFLAFWALFFPRYVLSLITLTVILLIFIYLWVERLCPMYPNKE